MTKFNAMHTVVYTEHTKTAAVSCGTSHVSAVSTPLRWILRNVLYIKAINNNNNDPGVDMSKDAADVSSFPLLMKVQVVSNCSYRTKSNAIRLHSSEVHTSNHTTKASSLLLLLRSFNWGGLQFWYRRWILKNKNI